MSPEEAERIVELFLNVTYRSEILENPINPKATFTDSTTTSNSRLKEEILNQLVIANAFLQHQNKTFLYSLAIGTPLLVLLALAQHFFNYPFIQPGIIATLSIPIILYLRKSLIQYRIVDGYFGSNRSEAIQLIQFIQQNSDDIDSDGGSQTKQVFPDKTLGETEAASGLEGLGEAI